MDRDHRAAETSLLRQQVNAACSAVLTLPKAIPDEKEKGRSCLVPQQAVVSKQCPVGSPGPSTLLIGSTSSRQPVAGAPFAGPLHGCRNDPASTSGSLSTVNIVGIGTATPCGRQTKSDCLAAFRRSEWFDRLHARAHLVATTVLLRIS